MAIIRRSSGIMRRSFPEAWRLGKRLLGRFESIPLKELSKFYNINQIQAMNLALNRNGWELRSFSSILDFGCGAGRLSQHLGRLASGAQLFGCDIDSEAIKEAQRLYPRGRFVANEPMPPLAFEDGQFDLVYAWVFFTNISEESHRAWLGELGRVLRPGGVLISTTHSYEYLKRVEAFSPEYLQKWNFSGTVEEFIQSDTGYYYVNPDHYPPDIGWSLISKEYVTTKWPAYSGLSLMDYSEAAFETYPEGCQDIVILAKEPIQPNSGLADY